MIGGGQDAMSVTTTNTRSGKFESRLFHMIFQTELGRVKGHFGPINTLAMHPDGHRYVSGGEDGYVRLTTFDDSYVNMRDDVDDAELLALEKQVKDAGLMEEANKESNRDSNSEMSKAEA